MIDWINPSDDVVEAKQIGYQEGWLAGEEVARELEARFTGEMRAAIELTKERNNALLLAGRRVEENLKLRNKIEELERGPELDDAKALLHRCANLPGWSGSGIPDGLRDDVARFLHEAPEVTG